MTVHKNKLTSGFTLIELLIVIAILGVLAVVVLVAINPVQQLARTRDAGRESGATQLGHAIEAYAVSHSGDYPTEDPLTDSWATDLVAAGEISIVPAAIDYSAGTATACGNAVANTMWCYDYDDTNNYAIVYARLESDSKGSLCAGTTVAWFVYSTPDGRGGVVCTADDATDPTAIANQTFAN